LGLSHLQAVHAVESTDDGMPLHADGLFGVTLIPMGNKENRITRFLTRESFIAPRTPEVVELMAAEQAKIAELAAQGAVEAAYAAADNSAMWLVWNRESQADLEEAHKTLPLHDYLQSDITLLVDEA